MADDNINKEKKQGQYGTGSQGTQEREQDITGSSGVQNKQGKTVDQGSTTGQKGGQGMGRPDQQNMGGGQRQGQPQRPQEAQGQSKPSSFGDSEESEDE